MVVAMGRPQGGLFSRHHCFNDQRFECLAEENILAHAVRVDAEMQAAPLALSLRCFSCFAHRCSSKEKKKSIAPTEEIPEKVSNSSFKKGLRI